MAYLHGAPVKRFLVGNLVAVSLFSVRMAMLAVALLVNRVSPPDRGDG